MVEISLSVADDGPERAILGATLRCPVRANAKVSTTRATMAAASSDPGVCACRLWPTPAEPFSPV